MAANLSPEYKKAEAAFRSARDQKERLDCLRAMLRTIPKHKGTEHLQADIKSRIKELSDELQSPGKGARRSGPVHTIRPEGAAQVALLGPPNTGKSSLHAQLTGSRTPIGPYPLTTHEPVPGMLAYEDVHLQLVDLPPVSEDYMEPWMVNALQPADAALLIVDPAEPACIEQLQAVIERLAERKIDLLEAWPGMPGDQDAPRGDDELTDPFRIELPTLLVATKCDLAPGDEQVGVVEELLGRNFPAVTCSAQTGQGCDAIGRLLFEGLQVCRVYTKTPGKPFRKDKPFTVRRGDTVMSVARLVHKDIAEGLRYARIWGSGVFAGQQVGPDHRVSDGDVVELHMR